MLLGRGRTQQQMWTRPSGSVERACWFFGGVSCAAVMKKFCMVSFFFSFVCFCKGTVTATYLINKLIQGADKFNPRSHWRFNWFSISEVIVTTNLNVFCCSVPVNELIQDTYKIHTLYKSGSDWFSFSDVIVMPRFGVP